MIRKITQEVFQTPDNKVHATYGEAETHVLKSIEERLKRLFNDVGKESVSPDSIRRLAASLTSSVETVERLADAVGYIYDAPDEAERPEDS